MHILYHVTVCSVTLLSLAGPSAQPRSAATSSDRSQALVGLELPADMAPTVYYTDGLQVRHDNFNRTRVLGNVQLRFQEKNVSNSSVWLRSPQSRALLGSTENQPERSNRVLVEPFSDVGVELELPAETRAGLEGQSLFFDTGNNILRVAGPATLHLSNGVRLLVHNTRLTLIERQPSGDRRIIVESFTPHPRRSR